MVSSALVTAQQTAAAAQALHAGTMHQQLLSGKSGADQPERDQITVPRFSTDLPEFAEAEKAVQDKIDHLMNIKGKKSVDSIHKELGRVMWEYVGMGRAVVLRNWDPPKPKVWHFPYYRRIRFRKCMRMRGVEKECSTTQTIEYSGVFEKIEYRQEFLSMLKQ